jgi:hypothetical protein
MLSRRERAVLEGIERQLQHSDPRLASRLSGSRRAAVLQPSLGMMWLILGAVPTLAAVQALMLSHLAWAFVAFVVAVATGCAYLICVPGDRPDSRSRR